MPWESQSSGLLYYQCLTNQSWADGKEGALYTDPSLILLSEVRPWLDIG